MDPGDLLLPAVKIDVRAVGDDPDYAVTIGDIKAVGAPARPDSANGSMVVLWTGWESRWGTPGRSRTSTRTA